MSMSKTLMVFDFDGTIVDDNSNIQVQYLLPSLNRTDRQSLYENRYQGPSGSMIAVFKLLHKHGVTEANMKARLEEIPLTDGMKELFAHLSSDTYDVIIVSDANTLFIDWLLDKHDIRQQVNAVYSNPAEFNDEGQLKLDFYHHQDWCTLSTPNLCKGTLYQCAL